MKRCILVFVLLLGACYLKSQTLHVSGVGSVTAQNVAVNIGGNATVSNGATALVGATVSISSNFVTGQDILGINGVTSGSDGSIAYSYNSTTGVLTLTGAESAANYQITLRKVTYTNTAALPTTAGRVITISLNAALPFSGTGHYYEFVSSTNISWTSANTAANAKTYFGLQGYLATITTSDENTFVYSKINSAGWLGGSDAASEGVWKWVSGPEAGTQFWQGGIAGSAVGGRFSNWALGQPDNCCAGGEHYLNYWDGDHWNDYPNVATGSISGYVVEYGGMAGDPVLHISDNVLVNFAPRVRNLTVATGTGIKWYSSAAGGTLYTGAEALVHGQHYYASQTVSGVESTDRLDVTANLVTQDAPTAGTHVATKTEVVWNWNAATGATGYKWSATNLYSSATDMGTATTKTETGLTCNVAYIRYVWAYNAMGCVSAVTALTQTTLACVSAPTLTTSAASNIGSTSATLNGDITSVNGANATTRGFKYSTTNGFDPATTGTNISETGTYTAGTFSLSPSGLTSSTTYYVVAYATNSAGTTYGSQVNFTTMVYSAWTFTNAGATGNTGPTQAEVNSAYSGTSLQGGVSINTQGIQEWTVPTTGTYRIETLGAQGGSSINSSKTGGNGARIIGDFSLSQGTVLRILVGQQGPNVDCTPGGGGGTFVAVSNSPYVVAGGGGGASSDVNGIAAVTGTSGTANTENTASGGTGGSGGGICTLGPDAIQHNGSGGGGFTGNGLDNKASNADSPTGGKSFLNGGIGGTAGTSSLANGGFGGGGAAGICTVGGGGGGGYSGGAGGEHYNNCSSTFTRSAGGGGGSYNAGSNGSNTAGFNSGHGQVIITKL